MIGDRHRRLLGICELDIIMVRGNCTGGWLEAHSAFSPEVIKVLFKTNYVVKDLFAYFNPK